jgi:hypothetical protein
MSTISRSVLTKKCDIRGELLPILAEEKQPAFADQTRLSEISSQKSLDQAKDSRDIVGAQQAGKISRSVLAKKCDILGEMPPISEGEKRSPRKKKSASPKKPLRPKKRRLSPSRSRSVSPKPKGANPVEKKEEVLNPKKPLRPRKKKLSPQSDSSSPIEIEPKPAKKKASPPKKAEQSNADVCQCFVKSRGEICGRKIKQDGRCGLHKLPKKCEVVASPPTPKPSVPESGQEEDRGKYEEEGEVVDIPFIGKFEVEKKANEFCQCIIKPKKKGEPERVCGRKAKKQGFCGFHAPPKKCLLPEEPKEEKEPVLSEEEEEEEIAREPDNIFENESAEEEEEAPELPEEVEHDKKGWTFKSAGDLRQVFEYLTKIPEESIDIGSVRDVQDAVLFYLRK